MNIEIDEKYKMLISGSNDCTQPKCIKRYIHYGHTKFDLHIFEQVQNMPFSSKPKGGLWASDENARYGWRDWCECSGFRECKKENSFSFSLIDAARVLYIDTIDDLDKLPKATYDFDFDFCLSVLLDFEKLAKIYDAIEVNFGHDSMLRRQLSTWDCDSILIMNPNIIVEYDNQV